MRLIKKKHLNIINKLKKIYQLNDDVKLFSLARKIKKNVCQHGDEALKKYLQEFDGVKDINSLDLLVSKEEIKLAYNQVKPDFIKAIKTVKLNLEEFHRNEMPKSWQKKPRNGVKYGLQYTPIEKVGIYVPGGKAIYPSSVLMNAVPALLARVNEIVMVTPPNKEGVINPAVLVTADLCGITKIYKVGGAQAIFALAYGTESIPKVDKIVGPGNRYVTIAKQMVYGTVDIDKPAGPSEILIYLDNKKYLDYAVIDFLSQLEHGEDSIAILISEDLKLLNQAKKDILDRLETCKRKEIIKKSLKNAFLFVTKSLDESIFLINEYAGEHLELLSDKANDIIKQIKHAGAIFLGPYTPIALGDYYAGPNHVLPTLGTARFSGPLGVMDFLKTTSILEYQKTALALAVDDIKILAEMEGLDAHFQTINTRIKKF